ncbi:MAG: rod shape-determining protein MreC [Actinomycetota bacterium]|nr:rod shape-determining protein MreC [Actinomycetota bacterium]
MSRPSRRRRLALTVLLLISLTFFTLDYRMSDGSAFSGLRAAAGSVIGPVQRTAAGVFAPMVRAISAVRGGSDDTDRLRRDNKRLTQQLRGAQLDRATAQQLQRLRLLAGAGGYRTVPGRVVALGPSAGLEWTGTIDVGTRDGVQPGMTVVNGDGLVGRVKRASAYTAVVLLAVDPMSAVGSRLEGSGQLGLCKGDGLHPMHLQLLDPQARVAVGDRLVTGPFGETTYAPGVPLGRVSAVLPSTGVLVRSAEVEPYVDFTALDVVGVVIQASRTDPRDSVLPPKPTPSPAMRPSASPVR